MQTGLDRGGTAPIGRDLTTEHKHSQSESKLLPNVFAAMLAAIESLQRLLANVGWAAADGQTAMSVIQKLQSVVSKCIRGDKTSVAAMLWM